MKLPKPYQLTLGLPVDTEITLERPLFYFKEKSKFGTIYKFCLSEGKHKVKLSEIGENLYEVTCEDGNHFIANMEHKNGVYKIKGAPQLTRQKESSEKDLNIAGRGKGGFGLRPAQSGAIYSLLSHWSLSNTVATIVLPTGTGKTETMLVATLADNAKRTLVIVPSIDLKLQTAVKFLNWGMLRELGIISYDTPNPKVLIMEKIPVDGSIIQMMERSEVVITTPAFIARSHQMVKAAIKELFSHVFFDEAHHVKATEWDLIKSLFANTKVVQFTATPYRNDKQPVDGKVVYNYPLSQALIDGCFSKISLISIDERHPAKQDRAIADAAMRRLLSDRKKGWKRA